MLPADGGGRARAITGATVLATVATETRSTALDETTTTLGSDGPLRENNYKERRQVVVSGKFNTNEQLKYADSSTPLDLASVLRATPPPRVLGDPVLFEAYTGLIRHYANQAPPSASNC